MKIANGVWSILGILAFLSIEKFFPDEPETSETTQVSFSKKSNKTRSKTKSKSTQRALQTKSRKFVFFHSFKV